MVECRGLAAAAAPFRETGLPWVFPSPNMPTPETALVYPGMCLLEGTNLSEGRGTTRPFELFGAPWLDGDAARRGARGASGSPASRFRPASFVPTWDKHAGVRCHGAELSVTDRERVPPVPHRPRLRGARRGAGARARSRWRTEPYEFVAGVPAFDLLCGSAREREGIEAGATSASWPGRGPPRSAPSRARRRRYLRYRD